MFLLNSFSSIFNSFNGIADSLALGVNDMTQQLGVKASEAQGALGLDYASLIRTITHIDAAFGTNLYSTIADKLIF